MPVNVHLHVGIELIFLVHNIRNINLRVSTSVIFVLNASGIILCQPLCKVVRHVHVAYERIFPFHGFSSRMERFCHIAFDYLVPITLYLEPTHYRIPPNSHTASEYDPSFHMAPDFGDGVDELGNLMRNCINFCFPNGYEWLAIHPQNRVRFNTVEPKTLLLSEASLTRPSQRLITKIRHFLEQEKGKELKQKYARIACDTKKVIELLDACCKEQEFHFYYEILLSEYEITKPEYIHVYSRLLLEHELREQMYEEARKNLREIAQKKFGALFLTDNPFGASS